MNLSNLELPEGWGFSKIKYVAFLKGRIGYRGYSVKDLVNKGDGVITLGPSNIVEDRLNLEKNVYISWFKYHESPEIQISKNDIVLVKTASVGKVAYINELESELTINPQLVKISSFKINSKYLYFFLRSNIYKDQILSTKEGGTTPTISQEKILNHYVILPLKKDQILISKYLEKKTKQIDLSIKILEKKITLLQEQKNALIQKYVMKGLDENVEMKDSGVSWIGNIPKHWKITKLKYLSTTKVQYGLNIESDFYRESGVRFLRITDINQDGYLHDKGGVYLEKSNVPDEYILRNGDILFSRTGATVGKSTLIESSSNTLSFAGYLVRFSFENIDISNFVSLFSRSLSFWYWINLEINQATIENVNGEKYSNLLIPLPPNNEMIEINKILKKRLRIINKIIKKVNSKKVFLNEYRQSLISSVVTGKIRIREDML